MVHPIKANGMGINHAFKFAMNPSLPTSSHVYTNLVLGLVISGSNFYLYPTFPYGEQSVPFTLVNDQTVIADSSGLFSNHIVIPFLNSMMVATWDDAG
jgi:hypothetical protein